MRIAIIIGSIPFVFRLILYVYHLVIVKKFLREDIEYVKSSRKINALVLIPVLREQRIIQKTINHFMKMQVDSINLHLVIVGTNREVKSDKASTIDIVANWINEYSKDLPSNIDIDYCEASDEGGDRATQLNYAVNYVKEKKGIAELDFVGVYDADSLPSERTLQEVINCFISDEEVGACQQPVHFAMAANEMARAKENPLLIANALYQSTWTAINELPMWIKYSKKNNELSRRHLYLIGHGEFITEKIYNSFQFPEYEITDGIQLGYRLGMSNIKVRPLHEFCNDDVPHKISTLVKQHKRWFGGCMNLLSAYRWAKDHYKTNAWLQLVDGLWSQARWAWTFWLYVVIVICAIFVDMRVLGAYLVMGVMYCYVFPIIAHKIMEIDVHVRFIDWVCLPIAIGLKSVGPNIYIISKILGKRLKYEKVER